MSQAMSSEEMIRLKPETDRRFEELAQLIRTRYSEVYVDLLTFPSGCAALDATLNGRTFVCDLRPQGWIGIDELGENEGFDSGYREAFHDFDAARARFLELLSQADAPAVAALSRAAG